MSAQVTISTHSEDTGEREREIDDLLMIIITTVRNYHKSFYRPDNLCLIITGQVSPANVFAALQPMEEKIMKKGPLPKMTRPWTTPVPPLLKSVDTEIEFPSEEDKEGAMVCILYLCYRYYLNST